MVHSTGKEQILKRMVPGPTWRINPNGHFLQVCKEATLVDESQYKGIQLCKLLLLPSPAVILESTIAQRTITMRFLAAFATFTSAVAATGSSTVTNLTPEPFYLWVVPDAWGSAISSRVLVEAGR